MSPVITTEQLSLRPFRIEDAQRVSKHAGRPAIARMVQNVPCPYPQLAVEGWIMLHDSLRRRSQAFPFAVATDDDGLVGAAGLHRTRGGWILGYWIGEPWQGRGYASEAAGALRDFAAGQLNLAVIGAEWFADNPASGRVLEKAGFTPTGKTADRFSLGRRARARSVEMEWRSGAAH